MTTLQVVTVASFALLSIGTAYFLLRRLLDLIREQHKTDAELRQSQKKVSDLQNRLELVHQLNTSMVEVGDGKAMVETVLDLIGGLVGAAGISFIPFDEWGEPLPAISKGTLPEPVLRVWSQHLATTAVRNRCKTCQQHEASHNGSCPLAGNPFQEIMNIQCLPINRGGREIGMLNLYTPVSFRLEAETRKFLEDLASELAIAVESIRLRKQELTTLRQLQMDRPAKLDLETTLGYFVDQVSAFLKGDFCMLVVQPVTESRPRLVVRSGLSGSSIPPTVERIIQSVIESGQAVSEGVVVDPDLFSSDGGCLAAVPLELVDKWAFGALLIGKQGQPETLTGDLELLKAVARQAALLIEQDQRMIDLEYTAVVKERSRLAREIHDGLAQTLAFLKLQTGQMQTYLGRGDIARLGSALQTNYQALSEAYLDIRQSIDNLRMTPSNGLDNWLEQLAGDFKKTTGMNVSLDVKLTPAIRNHISTEIQAQLIRIVQEALSNVRKHARGERVWISLREWNEDIILEVRDDGMGFSPEDVPGLSQYGLRGMRERAELIGADFQIISQPQKGTTVRIRLPYPLEETLA